jgi:diguanylate cyclase (GGDEF)-like protein
MPGPFNESDSAALLGALIDMVGALGAPLSLKDAGTGAYLFVNGAMADLLGRPVQHVLGANVAALLPAEEAAAIRRCEEGVLRQPEGHLGECTLERGGLRRTYRVCHRLHAAQGSAGLLIGLWFDETEAQRRGADLERALRQIEQHQAQLESMRRDSGAGRDAPRELFQHAHFEDQLRREVDLSMREHREFALVLVALDPPAEGGETPAAEARERIAATLGQLLRANIRAMDAPCRLGEDRFAVLLSGVGLATAHSRMEGLRRQCATQIVVQQGQPLGFTVSMGVATFPHTASTLEALQGAAEGALVEARRRGGNRITLASIRLEAAWPSST